MSSQVVPEHAEIPPPTIEEVSPGIFAYIQLDGTWFLNNAGAVLGDDGAIVVDTVGTEARARAFRKTYDELTDLPPQVLINTHSHGDHTHGNFRFAPDTAIVGHETCPSPSGPMPQAPVAGEGPDDRQPASGDPLGADLPIQERS